MLKEFVLLENIILLETKQRRFLKQQQQQKYDTNILQSAKIQGQKKRTKVIVFQIKTYITYQQVMHPFQSQCAQHYEYLELYPLLGLWQYLI